MVSDWESERGRWRCDVVGVVDLFLGNIIFFFLCCSLIASCIVVQGMVLINWTSIPVGHQDSLYRF